MCVTSTKGIARGCEASCNHPGHAETQSQVQREAVLGGNTGARKTTTWKLLQTWLVFGVDAIVALRVTHMHMLQEVVHMAQQDSFPAHPDMVTDPPSSP